MRELLEQLSAPLQRLHTRMTDICISRGALLCQRSGPSFVCVPDPSRPPHEFGNLHLIRSLASQLFTCFAEVRLVSMLDLRTADARYLATWICK
jgi:hypothetical protein